MSLLLTGVSGGRPIVSSGPPAGAVWLVDALDTSTLFQANDATTAVGTEADPVGYWADKSATAFHMASVTAGLSGTDRPLWHTDGTHAWVTADGVDDGLFRAASLGLYANLSCTQGFALKASPASQRQLFGAGRSSSNNASYSLTSTSSGGITHATPFLRNDVGTVVILDSTNVSGTIFDNTWRTLIITDDGSTISFYIDGVLSGTKTYTRSDPTTLDRQGLFCRRRASNDQFFAGSVAAAAAYMGVLSSGNIAAFHTWLASKHP